MNVEREKRILRFIVRYKREHQGRGPTFREINEAVGLNSLSLVALYLASLEKSGRIEMDEGVSRGIRLVGEEYYLPSWAEKFIEEEV